MKEIIYNEITTNRLDTFLKEKLNLSRNVITTMIKDKKILVNGKNTKTGYSLKNGDSISINDEKEDKNNKSLKENKIDLDIVYEDEYLMIVNKPSGLIVHPTNYSEEVTLAGGIKYYFKNKNINFKDDDYRWGICHRLDKDTSGLIIVAKSTTYQEILQEKIKNNEIKREYLGIIFGKLKYKKMKIDAPLKRNPNGKINMEVSQDNDAKDAITYIEEIERLKSSSLVKFSIETGRTHQIRVHCKYIGNPIINDPLYGNAKPFSKYNQYLQAYKINFISPFDKKVINIELEMPREFKEYIYKNKE